MNTYYEAYDKRYRQIHALGLQWSAGNPSPIVEEVICRNIPRDASILELGCGEGRDAGYLLTRGYNVLASDISPEAVDYCRKKFPDYADHFIQLNACSDALNAQFDFIYAVAVLHMLVQDEDRDALLSFIKDHLTSSGIALVLTMGDGEFQRASGTANAFQDAVRTHGETGQEVRVAETSCRIVNFETLEQELCRNGLELLEKGITSIEPDFPVIMYAIVK